LVQAVLGLLVGWHCGDLMTTLVGNRGRRGIWYLYMLWDHY
jgi:hypothetical protein